MENKDFLSSLLVNGDAKLIASFLKEYELSVEQIKKVLISPYAEMYIGILKESAGTTTDVASTDDEVTSEAVIVTDEVVPEVTPVVEETAPEVEVTAEEVPKSYFEELKNSKVFNLPKDDKASGVVRRLLDNSLRIFTKSNIFLMGQLVEMGMSGIEKLLNSKGDAEVLSRNLERVCGIEIGAPQPHLHIVLAERVGMYCREIEDKLHAEMLECKRKHKEWLLSRPLDEVEFFNQTGEIYASLSRAMKHQISKLKRELIAEGYNIVEEVVSLDEDTFLLGFKPERWSALQACLPKYLDA
ncbi:MAG: hypothetical protein E7005_05200 [Alphaproteobacteria bacterium]|nr:hypothetical protein [Alphaproteobacteria bacterium]